MVEILRKLKLEERYSNKERIMIIKTSELNKWNTDGFELNSIAERRIVNMTFASPIASVSQGNSPEWDVKLEDGTTIEVKFTDSTKPFIETHYGDGRPSGLSLSTADFYLIVQTGFWGDKKIGKVKVIPTDTLRDIADICEKRYYPASHDSPGSRGFILNRELGNNDGWVGNLNYDTAEGGFDLSGWQKGKAVKRIG